MQSRAFVESQGRDESMWNRPVALRPPPPPIHPPAVAPHCSLGRRQSSLALVCRRWAQVVSTSPALLQEVSVILVGDVDGGQMRRLRALAEWLMRLAAPHVRELTLKLLEFDEAPDFLMEYQAEEAQALVAAALATCGAAGRLGKLDLEVSWPLPVGPWLAPLGRGLQHLQISAPYYEVTLAGSLGASASACMLILEPLLLHCWCMRVHA